VTNPIAARGQLCYKLRMEIISASVCLPVDQAPLADGGIAIDHGKIVAVGTAAELAKQYPDATVHNHPKQALIPGLVNAHLHVDLAQFCCTPFVATPASETTEAPPSTPHVHWLRQSLEFRQKAQLPQIIESIQHCLTRLTQYGVTTVGAFSTYDAAHELFAKSGLRATIFAELFGSAPAEGTQDRFESALALHEKLGNGNNHIQLGLAPLAPYLLSRNVLGIVSQHAAADHIPLAIHAAESFEEMEFFFNSSGPIGTEIFPLMGWGAASGQELPPPYKKTPIQYLADIGFLAAHPTIIGGLHLSAGDVALLKKHACCVVFCPRAVRAFSLGEFPLGKLLEAGVTVALGTEAQFSSTNGDVWDEMRAALQFGGLPADQVLRMATLESAKTLGRADTIGSLTPGKFADYVLVDLPTPTSAERAAEQLIQSTTTTRVHNVVVGGKSLKNA